MNPAELETKMTRLNLIRMRALPYVKDRIIDMLMHRARTGDNSEAQSITTHINNCCALTDEARILAGELDEYHREQEQKRLSEETKKQVKKPAGDKRRLNRKLAACPARKHVRPPNNRKVLKVRTR